MNYSYALKLRNLSILFMGVFSLTCHLFSVMTDVKFRKTASTSRNTSKFDTHADKTVDI